MYVLKSVTLVEMMEMLKKNLADGRAIFGETVFCRQMVTASTGHHHVRVTASIRDIRGGDLLVDCDEPCGSEKPFCKTQSRSFADDVKSFCTENKLHFQPGILEA